MFMHGRFEHEMQCTHFLRTDDTILASNLCSFCYFLAEILLRLDRPYYRSNTSTEVLNAILAAKEGVLNRISDVCGSSINFLERPDGSQLKWNYYNSVFFAFTIVTTIGESKWKPFSVKQEVC